MQRRALNDDITLRIVYFLDLCTIISLSKACQDFYHLSLSSLSFWINAVDAYRFPVSIPNIRDHYKPEEVRYMARVITCYQKKIEGEGQEGSKPLPESRKMRLSSVTRVKFRQEDLVRMASKGQDGLVGVSSTLVQGHTPDSLPWLISVRETVIRCDSIDEEFVVGTKWDADGMVNWNWRYDIIADRDADTGGKLREYVIITFLTSNGATTLIQKFGHDAAGYKESLQTIKIYLPQKTELVPVPKAVSYLGAFGTLISSNTPPVAQDPSAPTPRVVHHDRVNIADGFNCGMWRPSTAGSLVYFLARKKRTNPTLGVQTSLVFVYDWMTKRALQVTLPEGRNWSRVTGFGHTVILQDWTDRMYVMDLSSEFAVPFSPPAPGAEGPSPLWRLTEGTPITHIPLKRPSGVENTPVVGNIVQTNGESFCLISKLGERSYCHLFQRSSPPSEESRTTPHPGFSHVVSNHVDIGIDKQHPGVLFLHKSRGARTLLVFARGDGSERTVNFFVVDFDIQDGTGGSQMVRGRKQEMLVRGEGEGRSQSPSSGFRRHVQSGSLGSKIKGTDQVLARHNMQEIFYDGFRGTVGLINKQYSEIVLLRVTQD